MRDPSSQPLTNDTVLNLDIAKATDENLTSENWELIMVWNERKSNDAKEKGSLLTRRTGCMRQGRWRGIRVRRHHGQSAQERLADDDDDEIII